MLFLTSYIYRSVCFGYYYVLYNKVLNLKQTFLEETVIREFPPKFLIFSRKWCPAAPRRWPSAYLMWSSRCRPSHPAASRAGPRTRRSDVDIRVTDLQPSFRTTKLQVERHKETPIGAVGLRNSRNERKKFTPGVPLHPWM